MRPRLSQPILLGAKDNLSHAIDLEMELNELRKNIIQKKGI